MSAIHTAQLSRPHDVDASVASTTYDHMISTLIVDAILLYAFDAAFPAPGSVYKANGGIAANVYVSGTYAQDAAHVSGLRAAGVAPWPNYEVGLWELVSNRTAGQAAARVGVADAIRCGFPSDGSIWFPFSVDVNVDPTRYYQVRDAFLGIQDVNAGRYLISFYGQGALAAYLRQNRVINQKCWLSASSSFPGYNTSSPDICVWQQVGNFIPGYSTDRNVITDVSSIHAWWPDNSPYGGTMTQTDIDAINAHIDSMIGLILYGDGRYAALGIPDPATGKIPPQGHPWNLVQNKMVSEANGKQISTVKSQTDTLEATAAAHALAITALDARITDLQSQVAGLPVPPTPTEIANAVGSWQPTSDQLAVIATVIARLLPQTEYAGKLTPVIPSPTTT